MVRINIDLCFGFEINAELIAELCIYLFLVCSLSLIEVSQAQSTHTRTYLGYIYIYIYAYVLADSPNASLSSAVVFLLRVCRPDMFL